MNKVERELIETSEAIEVLARTEGTTLHPDDDNCPECGSSFTDYGHEAVCGECEAAAHEEAMERQADIWRGK